MLIVVFSGTEQRGSQRPLNALEHWEISYQYKWERYRDQESDISLCLLPAPEGQVSFHFVSIYCFRRRMVGRSQGRVNSEIIKDNIASKSVSAFSNSISYSNKRCYLLLQTLTGLYPFITASTTLLLQEKGFVGCVCRQMSLVLQWWVASETGREAFVGNCSSTVILGSSIPEENTANLPCSWL